MFTNICRICLIIIIIIIVTIPGARDEFARTPWATTPKDVENKHVPFSGANHDIIINIVTIREARDEFARKPWATTPKERHVRSMSHVC